VHLVKTITYFIEGDNNDGFGDGLPKYMLEYINYKLPVWANNAVKARYDYIKD
jgi:hypothetical protein